ncbi:hypothetical protein ACOMHN_062640 [Nucella lapillus]
MLSTLSCVRLVMRISGLTVTVTLAGYLGDALYISAYFTLCMMTQYERTKGVHSSTVPFIFWLLMSLCNVIPLYTMIMEERYVSHTVNFTLFLMSYGLQICSLLLSACVNNDHVITDVRGTAKVNSVFR